jgi:trimethylguanosine synthase
MYPRFEIIAVESDIREIKAAKSNARVYGVENDIEFVHGDCFQVLKEERFQGREGEIIIFASPPWGGPDYLAQKVFDLETMEPYSLSGMHAEFSKVTKEVVYFLPRSSDYNQIAAVAEGVDGSNGQDDTVKVVQYSIHGAIKVRFHLCNDINLTIFS